MPIHHPRQSIHASRAAAAQSSRQANGQKQAGTVSNVGAPDDSAQNVDRDADAFAKLMGTTEPAPATPGISPATVQPAVQPNLPAPAHQAVDIAAPQQHAGGQLPGEVAAELQPEIGTDAPSEVPLAPKRHSAAPTAEPVPQQANPNTLPGAVPTRATDPSQAVPQASSPSAAPATPADTTPPDAPLAAPQAPVTKSQPVAEPPVTGRPDDIEPQSMSTASDAGQGDADTSAGEESDSSEPPIPMISTGDAILQSLGQTAPTKVEAVQVPMTSVVHEVADQILVSEVSTAGEQEIHITIKDSILPGTQVQLVQEQGHLAVRFTTTADSSHEFLTQQKAALQEHLESRLENRSVQIDISMSSDSEGRSRGGGARQWELSEDED